MIHLCLAEYQHQVVDILKNMESKNLHWVALGPSAIHELTRRGIQHNIPEDLCSLSMIENACTKKYELLKDISIKWDNLLILRDPFLKEWKIRPFLFNLWQLSQCLDILVARTLQIKKIIEKFPNARIYVHVSHIDDNWGYFGIDYSPKETLWGKLLSLPGWNTDIKLMKEKNHLYQSGKWPPKRFIKLGKQSVLLTTIFWSYVNGFYGNIYKLLPEILTKKKKNILVLNAPYDWKNIFNIGLFREYRFLFFKPHVITQRFINRREPKVQGFLENALWKEIHTTIEPEPVNYLSLLKDRLGWIRSVTPVLSKYIISHARNLLERKKIVAVLNAVSLNFAPHVYMAFFKKMNIPVFKWQHGSVWFHNRITQRVHLNDLVDPKVLFVYGDEVKQAYENHSNKFLGNKCEVVSVGSTTLDNLRQSVMYKKNKLAHKNCKPIKILYIISNYYCNSWYCGFSPPFSDNLYYKDQCSIISRLYNLIEKRNDILVTVKLYPKGFYDYDPPWLNQYKKNKKLIITRNQIPTSELLYTHDITIIDCPTTILLEALCTEIKTFVLSRTVTWPKEAIRLLKKLACVSDEPDRLIDQMEIKINKRSQIERTDAAFLQRYGLHKTDGNSAIRAVEKIKYILEHTQL